MEAEENMVKVSPNKEHCYYLDGYLKSNLDHAQGEVLKKDFDFFLVIDGREGYGKSTLAHQVAMHLDPTYNLERCCFSAEQFKDAVDSATKGQAIVFDETMGYLSSRGSMTKFNKMLVKIFSEMRSKNLFIILCITSFFELDKYPAIHRSVSLINIYKRSFMKVYNYNSKKNLYVKGKKFYSYCVPASFIGRCTKYFPLDKEKYEKKKQEAIKQWETIKGRERKLELQRNSLILECYKNKWSAERLAEVTGLSLSQIHRIIASQRGEI